MEVSECTLHTDYEDMATVEDSGSHGNSWNTSGSLILPAQQEFPLHPFCAVNGQIMSH